MKALLISILALFSILCYGQTSSENDSTRLIKERMDRLLNLRIQQESQTLGRRMYFDYSLSFDELNNGLGDAPETVDMNLSTPQVYVGPLSDYLANPIGNPFVYDYRFDGYYRITGSDWITTTSLNTTYPLIGSLNLVDINYNFQLTDRLSGSVGAYAARYYYQTNLHYDSGINASLRYELDNRFSLIGFGQYSARGNMNKVGGDNGWMFPQTYYGVGGEFKINEKVRIQSGMMRKLDPMTGKWANTPFFRPVISFK